MRTLLLTVTSPRSLRLLVASGLVAGSWIVANGAMSADALSCTDRVTQITASFPEGEVAQDARAYNRKCSGGKSTLELKIVEDQTGVPDDEVAKTTFQVTLDHDKHLYGCDRESGTFFAEQKLEGSKKKSTYRGFKDCYLT